MNQSTADPDRFFFGTRLLPCPYVPGRRERKIVAELDGPDAEALYERMSQAGFRRSHGLAYRPACPRCAACVPIRIRAGEFEMSRSVRRVARINADLETADLDAVATLEHYRLFVRYQTSRHCGGEMSSMTFEDYRSMVEDTPVDTRIVEFREPDGALMGTILVDRMRDALSAVYSFFAPEPARRSLGTFMVLRLVEAAQARGLSYVYLGYWIADSEKMSYKTRFRPAELLGPDGWVVHRDASG